MRAVWYDRQGPASEVIVQGELPTPEPGLGEVRVKLEASGVNPSDTYRRRGAVPAEYARVIPNSDGAGVVDKVGSDVSPKWIGKRVWLYNGQRNGRWMGTAAEYISLNADLVTPLPDHVSFAQGATLGIPGMTAHGCVFVAGPVQGRISSVQKRLLARSHWKRRRSLSFCANTNFHVAPDLVPLQNSHFGPRGYSGFDSFAGVMAFPPSPAAGPPTIVGTPFTTTPAFAWGSSMTPSWVSWSSIELAWRSCG